MAQNNFTSSCVEGTTSVSIKLTDPTSLSFSVRQQDQSTSNASHVFLRRHLWKEKIFIALLRDSFFRWRPASKQRQSSTANTTWRITGLRWKVNLLWRPKGTITGDNCGNSGRLWQNISFILRRWNYSALMWADPRFLAHTAERASLQRFWPVAFTFVTDM